MDGEADGLALVGKGALDGLFDPPCAVSAEFAPFAGIEPFDSLDEAKVAFTDEIEEREAKAGLVLCDFDDKAEVRADEGFLGFQVASFDFRCQLDFFLRRDAVKPTDFAQVYVERRSSLGRGVIGILVGSSHT
jgi:hypothetical protein